MKSEIKGKEVEKLAITHEEFLNDKSTKVGGGGLREDVSGRMETFDD